jgi:hypothetical protein
MPWNLFAGTFPEMPSKLFDGTFRGCLRLLFQVSNSGAAEYFLRHFLSCYTACKHSSNLAVKHTSNSRSQTMFKTNISKQSRSQTSILKHSRVHIRGI